MAALLLGAPVAAQVAVGDRPDVDLGTFDGRPASLEELRGSVVLVDFWATWCAPCRASFPFYAELEAQYGPQGFAVVAVSVDTDAGALEEFLAGPEAPPFRVAWDRDHGVVGTFEPPTMPTSYLLDRSGAVRFVHYGFGAEDRDVIRSEVEALLSESPIAASP